MAILDDLKSENPEFFLTPDGKSQISDMAAVRKLAAIHNFTGDINEYADKLGAQRDSLVGEFMDGAGTALSSMLNDSTTGLEALGAGLVGADDAKKYYLKQYQEEQNRIASMSNSSAPTQLEDIKTPGDAARWAAFNMGSAASQMIPTMVSAGVGAKAGQMAVQGGIKSLTEEAAKEAIISAAKTGALVGTSLQIAPQQLGQTYTQDVSKGIDNPYVAIAQAIPKTLIENITELGVVKRLFPGTFGEQVAERMAQKLTLSAFAGSAIGQAVKVGASEAAEEAAQESVDITAEKLMGDLKLNSPEVRSRVLNAAAAGFMGGFGIGGAEGGYHAIHESSGVNVNIDPVFNRLKSNQDNKKSQQQTETVISENPVNPHETVVDTSKPEAVTIINTPPEGIAPDGKSVAGVLSNPITKAQIGTQAEADGAQVEAVTDTASSVVAPQIKAEKLAKRKPKKAPVAAMEAPKEVPTESTVSATNYTLPTDLGNPKPRYKSNQLQFSSDVDKALYIVAQQTKSKQDAKFRGWLTDTVGIPADQLDTRAKEVKAHVGASVGTNQNAIVQVPQKYQQQEAPAVQAVKVAPAMAATDTEGKQPVAPLASQPTSKVVDNVGNPAVVYPVGKGLFSEHPQGPDQQPTFLDIKSPAAQDQWDEAVKNSRAKDPEKAAISALSKKGYDGVQHSDGTWRAFSNTQNREVLDRSEWAPNGDRVKTQFAGVNAKTVNMFDLSKAEMMERIGASREDILKRTGFIRGDDGKWRFEISDDKAVWNASKSGAYKLGEILNHPSLFAAYPELRNLDVVIEPMKDHGLGFFDPQTNTLHLSSKLSGKDASKILMHEVQHWIQFKEGFAIGGSPESYASLSEIDKAKQAAALMTTYEQIDNAGAFPDYLQSDIERLVFAAAQMKPITGKMVPKQIVQITKELRDQGVRAKDIVEETNKAIDENVKAYNKYRSLSGEIEANNTMGRMDLNEMSRRFVSPDTTREIPRDKAIVVLPDGTEVPMSSYIESNPDAAVEINGADSVYGTPAESWQKMSDAANIIRDVVKSIVGDKASIQFYNDLMAFDRNNNQSTLRGFQVANTIGVALGMNSQQTLDPMETGLHEAFHYVWGNLKDSDKATLEANKHVLAKYTRTQMRKIYGTDMLLSDIMPFDAEEVSAMAFGLYAKNKLEGKDAPINEPKTNKIIGSILNLFKKLGNALAGRGFTSADDIFKGVLRGDYKADGSLQPATAARFQQAIFEKNMEAVDKAKDRAFAVARETGTDAYAKEAIDHIKGLGYGDAGTELSNIGRFFSWFNSIPELARKDPVWARVFRYVRQRAEDLIGVQQSFALDLAPIMANQDAAKKACEVLDYLNANKKPFHIVYKEGPVKGFNSTPAVRYTREDGKLVELDKATSDAVVKLDKMFKKNLDLYADIVYAKLPQDLRSLQSLQQFVSENEQAGTAVPREKAMLETVQLLDQLKKQEHPYFPHSRFGEFGVSVKNNKGDTVHFEMFERSKLNGQLDKAAVEKRREELKKQYPDHEVSSPFQLSHDRIKAALRSGQFTSEDIIASLLSDKADSDLSGLIEQNREKLSDEQFAQRLTTRLKKNYLEKRDIAGYSKDYLRVIDSYFRNTPRALVQEKYRQNDNALRLALESSQIDNKKKRDLNKYIDYIMNPESDMGMVRSINFAATLGMNPASAILQTFGLATYVPATLMQWKSNPVAVNYLVAKASKDAFTILNRINDSGVGGLLVGKTNGGERLANIGYVKHTLGDILSPQEMETIVDLFNSGDILPVTAHHDVLSEANTTDFMSKTSFGLRKAGNGAMRAIAGPMSAMEQFTRLSCALATLRSLKGADLESVKNVLAKGDNDFAQTLALNLQTEGNYDKALTKAIVEHTIDRTHAVFGKFARNENQRGAFGALIFPFMNYAMQTLEYTGHLVAKSPNDPAARRALAYLAVSTMFLGGMCGLPAWDLLKGLVEKLAYVTTHNKIDLNYEIQRLLKESGALPSSMVDAAMHGVPGATMGVDISSRVSLPFFWQNLALSVLDGQPKVSQFMGVQGSLVSNAITQAQRANRGDIGVMDAAVMTATPVFVRNIWDAAAVWPNEGVRSGKGQQLLTADDITVADQLKKALGFTPESVADARLAAHVMNLKTYGPIEQINNATSRLANIKLDIEQASKLNNQQQAQALREKYAAEKNRLVQYIRNTDGAVAATRIQSIEKSIASKYKEMKKPGASANQKQKSMREQINKSIT